MYLDFGHLEGVCVWGGGVNLCWKRKICENFFSNHVECKSLKEPQTISIY